MTNELGTRLDLEGYIQRMDAAEADKLSRMLPFIKEVVERNPAARLLSIGAGSGKLEKHIASIFPSLKVVGLDYSSPMIEQINGESGSVFQEKGQPVSALLARGEQLPFAAESFDLIITCSVVHEIASFSDGHELGTTTQQLFAEIGRVLKPNGRYICRDFMQAENPRSQVRLKIGEKKNPTEADPAKFANDFLEQFTGVDKERIRKQLAGKDFQSGMAIEMSLADALEFIIHYSWSKRFADEVKERYTYLPPREYAEFVIDCLHERGYEAKMLAAYAYLQNGYAEHTAGRIALVDESGLPLELPPFTGVIAVEKIG
jgi:ubiquinone/menaquinone biosynthesis C-methylase UbiE